MHIQDILNQAVESKASDLHLVVGNPPMIRVDGVLRAINDHELREKDTLAFAKNLLSASQFSELEEEGHVDFSYETSKYQMLRFNISNIQRKLD